MVKQKTNKMLAVMLVLAVMLTSLIAGAMLLAPNTVSAAEVGSSATLAGNTFNSSDGYSVTAWYSKLGSTGVTKYNIVNLVITNDNVVTIEGVQYDVTNTEHFTKGTNIKDSTSQNDLYYYYKANATDSTLYDVVIYADVETIYAPVYSVGLFQQLSNCKTITFENFNTSNVTDMFWMFAWCNSLTSLDLRNFNTSNVTSMGMMFSDCTSLTSLDVSNFNTGNVTDMSFMFTGCESLTSLDLRNFNTSNVTSMQQMFIDCSSLTSLDVRNFNTSNVIDMSNMFYNCTSLTSLDLSSFDMTKVTAYSDMFSSTNISVIYAPKVANTDVSLGRTYYYLDTNGEIQSTSKLISQIGAEKTKLAKNADGAFNNVLSSSWKSKITSVYSDFVANCTSIVITTQTEPVSYTSKIWVGNLTEENSPIYAYVTVKGTSYDVVIYADVETIYAPVNSSYLFSLYKFIDSTHVSNLKTITLENFNTSNVTDMGGMFSNCTSLTSLDVSNLDTSNVTYMSGMFYGCSSLTNLDVSENFASNVTDMSSMFNGCSSLTNLDVSNFNTSKVTDMNGMFAGCSSLTSLDLSNFDTSNVTDMNSMFGLCTNLTYVNTSYFNTSKVTNFFGMFASCEKMEVLDLTSFTFNSITSAQGVLGMLGINDTLVLGTLQFYGATDLLEAYQQAMQADSLDSKIQVVAIALENLFGMTAEDALLTSQSLFAANIHTIYAPAQDVTALSIALPYNNNGIYVYDNGSGEQETQFLVGRGSLEQMAIYPKGDTPTILPPDVGEIDPDTPESGVTLVDLLILTMLTLTLSGVCVIILKNKNKSLIKK